MLRHRVTSSLHLFRPFGQRHRSVAFRPELFETSRLERRNLTAPIFTLVPGRPNPDDQNQAQLTGVINNGNPSVPASTSSNNQSPALGNGASEQVSLSGYPVYYTTSNSGGQRIMHTVAATGIGSATTSMQLPTSGSNTGSSVIQLTDKETQAWTVDTDANGGYPLNGAGSMSSLVSPSNGTFQMNSLNPDGSSPSGTVTVTFDVSVSPPDTSGPNGSSRFPTNGYVKVWTNYVNIDVGIGEGGSNASVTLPGSQTILKSDPGFSSAGNVSFAYTGTFPVQSILNLNYGSSLQTSINGSFGAYGSAEHAQRSTSFSWNFSIVANG